MRIDQSDHIQRVVCQRKKQAKQKSVSKKRNFGAPTCRTCNADKSTEGHRRGQLKSRRHHND